VTAGVGGEVAVGGEEDVQEYVIRLKISKTRIKYTHSSFFIRIII